MPKKKHTFVPEKQTHYIKMKNKTIEIKLQSWLYEELSESDRILVDLAKEATFSSYSPYSKFSVGAALLLENGTVVKGCNNENAAYPVTLCAERTAIFSAQAQYPNVPIVALAVAARNMKGEFVVKPVTPCGSCRQVIAEQEYRYGRSIRVLMVGEDEILIAKSVKDILPLCFEEGDMK